MSDYHLLSTNELKDALKEIHQHLLWVSVVKTARNLYGDKSHRIELEFDGQYDDEGGTDWNVTGMAVYDADDNELSLDYDTPFWKNHEDTDESDVVHEALYDIGINDQYDMSHFEVNKSPAIRYSELYILE